MSPTKQDIHPEIKQVIEAIMRILVAMDTPAVVIFPPDGFAGDDLVQWSNAQSDQSKN